jgi:hypothetical protein
MMGWPACGSNSGVPRHAPRGGGGARRASPGERQAGGGKGHRVGVACNGLRGIAEGARGPRPGRCRPRAWLAARCCRAGPGAAAAGPQPSRLHAAGHGRDGDGEGDYWARSRQINPDHASVTQPSLALDTFLMYL